jgi:hypothetical protein
MAFAEDLTAFFADFSVPATLGAASFAVIFDAAYIDALGISTNQPAAVCKSTDVAACSLGTAININGTAYTVREVKPDGTGLTTLMLELA